MRALIPAHDSRAIIRIGAALQKYAPGEVRLIPPMRKDSKRSAQLPGEADGDLVVLPINGLRDHWQALAARCRARGQRYAVVQIALRTSRHPSTEQWRDLWRGAAVVWSYYPLGRWIAEDGGAPLDFPFYHAPLGVDGSVFTPGDGHALRGYTVLTSGFRRHQEGVAECDEAAAAVDGCVFQLGPTFSMKAETFYGTGLEDDELARIYQQCQWVSGLRRTEGFELPAAEGLLCGARPLLFDRPHYRCWYESWGDFVTEGGRTVEELTRLFERGPRPVTGPERDAAARLFDWERICRGFWERCDA